MMKVWLLVAFLHTPNLVSVKYEAYVYSSEENCMNELVKLKNTYEEKPNDYKSKVKVDAHCFEFESFTINKFIS